MSDNDSRPNSGKKSKGKGKSKVTIEPASEPVGVSEGGGDAAAATQLKQQVAELQAALRSSEQKLAERDRELKELKEETAGSVEKIADANRSSARRLAQIRVLETTLETQKRREQTLENELVKHTKMMDSVMNYRDKECMKEYNEMLHDNAELAEKCARWKERAQMLQQERWGFVQRWRKEKLAALEAGRSQDMPVLSKDVDSDGEEEESEDGGGGGDGGEQELGVEDDDDW